MTTQELINLMNESKLSFFSFDGDRFEFGFENGIVATVTIDSDHESYSWGIQTNIEKSESEARWQKRLQEDKEKKDLLSKKKKEILSKFPEDQWAEIINVLRQ